MPNRNRLLLVCVLLALQVMSHVAWSQGRSPGSKKSTRGGTIRDYRSPNFLVHTDLAPTEAKELLGRLETMLKLISGYWGRRNRGIIECYVVEKISNWPANSMAPEGRRKVEEGAGVTLARGLRQGTRFLSKATVYAVANRGTPQHEAVHAYCHQAFGRTGPTWYSEGMAEMGQYWKKGDTSVNAHPGVINYLRKSKPKQLTEIVAPNQRTGDSWQNYAWRWALCHLLAYNPNYAQRFRPLGLALLNGQPVTFEQTYGSVAAQINFEYHFFLKHLQPGLRIDLCAWDWDAKFQPLATAARSKVARVVANRGWQPSGLQVTDSAKYAFVCTGKWKTAKAGKLIGGDGGDDGKGRLMGIVLSDDLRLSAPFELGQQGTFTAPAAGRLYLRCRDDWNSIHDNSGRMSVKLNVAK